jgi:hypothetical protein
MFPLILFFSEHSSKFVVGSVGEIFQTEYKSVRSRFVYKVLMTKLASVGNFFVSILKMDLTVSII